MKVEIDIITSIETSLIARAVILVIVFVDIFTTDVIVFIGYVIMHWPIILSIRVIPLMLTTSLGELKWKMSKLP
jgi:hypothetical protein